MDVSIIAQWFDAGCNYSEGVTILETWQPNCPELFILKRRESLFNKEKLEKLLKIQLDKAIETNAQSSSGLEYPQYNFFELPENLQKLHFEKGEAYKKAGQLHADLENNPQNAGEILRLMDINRNAWSEIDYYIEHGHQKSGQKPEVLPDIINMTTAELARFKTNNASNLSKWKGKLKKMADGAEKQELKIRIDKHTQLQAQARALLDAY